MIDFFKWKTLCQGKEEIILKKLKQIRGNMFSCDDEMKQEYTEIL